MTLNLSPQIEATLNAAAQQRGVDIETLIERMVKEQFTPAENKAAPELSEKKKAMIAWLDEQIAKAPTDPEGIRQAQAELDELMENLNRNRIESGESPLLP